MFKPGFVSGPATPGAEKKKKALDFLDEQIKQNLSSSMKKTIALKKNTSPAKDSLSSLEFNDLEIDFDSELQKSKN